MFELSSPVAYPVTPFHSLTDDELISRVEHSDDVAVIELSNRLEKRAAELVEAREEHEVFREESEQRDTHLNGEIEDANDANAELSGFIDHIHERGLLRKHCIDPMQWIQESNLPPALKADINPFGPASKRFKDPQTEA